MTTVLNAVIAITDDDGRQRISTISVEGALVLTVVSTIDGEQGSVTVQFAPESLFICTPKRAKA